MFKITWFNSFFVYLLLNVPKTCRAIGKYIMQCTLYSLTLYTFLFGMIFIFLLTDTIYYYTVVVRAVVCAGEMFAAAMES